MSQLRRFVTGERDVVIHGLLEDADDPVRLRVWVDGSPDEWLAPLEGDSFGPALDAALTSLSRDVLSALKPTLFAQICWARGQYNRAVELLESQEPSPECEIDLIQIDIERGYNRNALKRVDQFLLRTPKVSRDLRTKVEICRAEALTKTGNYDRARTIIQEQLRLLSSSARLPHLGAGAKNLARHVHILRTRLAATYSCNAQDEAAIEVYREAERDALREAARILEGGPDFGLEALLERSEYGALPEEVDPLLWQLYEMYEAAACCQRALGRDSMAEYDNALRVLRALSFIPRVNSGVVSHQLALIWKAVGQHQHEADPQVAAESYGRALELYEQSVELLRAELARDYEDLSVRSNLAWSTYGRLACLHRLLSLEGGIVATTEPETLLAADAIAKLMRGVPPHAAELLKLAVQQASEVTTMKTDDARAAFARGAGRFVERIVADVELEQLRRWVHTLEYLEVKQLEGAAGAASEVGMSEAYIQQQCPPIAKGTPANELVAGLYGWLVRALTLLASREREQSLRLIDVAGRRIDRDDARRQTWDQFELLWGKGERHHEAEAAYGFACYHSLLGEMDESVAWLGRAIEWTDTEGGSNEYRSRARLDEDLDDVRREPGFRRLVDAWTSCRPPVGLGERLTTQRMRDLGMGN